MLQHPLQGAVGGGEELPHLLAADVVERAWLRDLVDVHPVGLVGRHPAGRGVGLAQVALLLEHRHLVADGRRGHADGGVRGDVGRPDRLSGLDVLPDDGPEDLDFRSSSMTHPRAARSLLITQPVAIRLPSATAPTGFQAR